MNASHPNTNPELCTLNKIYGYYWDMKHYEPQMIPQGRIHERSQVLAKSQLRFSSNLRFLSQLRFYLSWDSRKESQLRPKSQLSFESGPIKTDVTFCWDKWKVHTFIFYHSTIYTHIIEYFQSHWLSKTLSFHYNSYWHSKELIITAKQATHVNL